MIQLSLLPYQKHTYYIIQFLGNFSTGKATFSWKKSEMWSTSDIQGREEVGGSSDLWWSICLGVTATTTANFNYQINVT